MKEYLEFILGNKYIVFLINFVFTYLFVVKIFSIKSTLRFKKDFFGLKPDFDDQKSLYILIPYFFIVFLTTTFQLKFNNLIEAFLGIISSILFLFILNIKNLYMIKKVAVFLCYISLFTVPIILWYYYQFIYAFMSFFIILGLSFYLTNQTNFIGSILFSCIFVVPILSWQYLNIWVSLITFIVFLSCFSSYKR